MDRIEFETLQNYKVKTTKNQVSCMYAMPLDKQWHIQIGPSIFKVNQLTYLQIESIVYPKIIVTNEQIEAEIKEELNKELNNDKLSTNEAPGKSNKPGKRKR